MAVGHERTIGSKGHGLWGIPHAQLPAKIQHVYNDLVESGHPVGGPTYRLAVGIVKNWAAGHDGKGNRVGGKTQAEALAAMTEFEKLRAKAKARTARKGAKDVSEGKIDRRTERAARQLLDALRDAGTSPRNLDRAASLTARIAGERPRDHAHAAELLEAMLGDCGCGGHPVAEAKARKGADDGGGDDELAAEVERLKKKGMPEKLARKAAQKKLAGKVEEAAAIEDEALEEAALSAEARKKLKGSDFVFPADKRYPIHDLAHARNALARSSGKPEEGKVKAAVHKRYPQLREAGEHSRLGGRLAEGEWDAIKHPRARGGKFAGKRALSPMKGGESDRYGSRLAPAKRAGDARYGPKGYSLDGPPDAPKKDRYGEGSGYGHSRLAHRKPPTKHSR